MNKRHTSRRVVASTATPPPDCPVCAGQTEWSLCLRRDSDMIGVAVCHFCGNTERIDILEKQKETT